MRKTPRGPFALIGAAAVVAMLTFSQLAFGDYYFSGEDAYFCANVSGCNYSSYSYCARTTSCYPGCCEPDPVFPDTWNCDTQQPNCFDDCMNEADGYYYGSVC
jgi:hypothetical protein